MNNLEIPTQEEALLIYLQNQINQTDANIIRITQSLIHLNKCFEEAQSRESRMEWARLIDAERLSLENYSFRLDFLQNQWEELQSTIKDNMWYINKHNLV